MNNYKRKTLLIDLDGVLNIYTGNYQEGIIPPIKDGAIDFIKDIHKNYDLKLFTTRDKQLAQKWLMQYGLEDFIQNVTNIKEPCYLYIDDRCIRFNGNYSQLEEEIKNFKVWYKK